MNQAVGGFPNFYQPVNCIGQNYQEQCEQSTRTPASPNNPTLLFRPGYRNRGDNPFWGHKQADALWEQGGVGPNRMALYEEGDGYFIQSGAASWNWTPSSGGLEGSSTLKMFNNRGTRIRKMTGSIEIPRDEARGNRGSFSLKTCCNSHYGNNRIFRWRLEMWGTERLEASSLLKVNYGVNRVFEIL